LSRIEESEWKITPALSSHQRHPGTQSNPRALGGLAGRRLSQGAAALGAAAAVALLTIVWPRTRRIFEGGGWLNVIRKKIKIRKPEIKKRKPKKSTPRFFWPGYSERRGRGLMAFRGIKELAVVRQDFLFCLFFLLMVTLWCPHDYAPCSLTLSHFPPAFPDIFLPFSHFLNF